MDHVDKAEQRSAILIPATEARDVTALDLPGDPVGKVPIVVIFDRAAPDAAQYQRLVQALPPGTETVLVLPGTAAADLPDLAVTEDSQRIIEALRTATPQDGGFPIGYAVLDSAGRLRYQTLDPTYLEHASEVATMAGAVQ